MQPKTQNDFVDQFMQKQDTGKEITEQVKVPGVEEYFNRLPTLSQVVKGKNKNTASIDPKTEQQKLPNLKILHEKNKDEIAQVLLLCLDRRGITGFEWHAGKDALAVSFLDSFEQKKLSDPERDQVHHILTNVLKSRRCITGIKWEFGKEFIEVTYIF